VNLEVATQATEQDNLRVLTTGPLPPNPAELLGSQRMRAILEQLKAGSDLLIFDSPPLQAVTDAAILSSFMDGTILVIDASRRRRGAVRLSRGALDRAGAKVLGAVLNRIPVRAKADYADYYGAYGGESATLKQARSTDKQPERSAP
jgi:capsular exopolysaccharide synthesis family protein